MTASHIFIDFDETLFDWRKYRTWLDDFVATEFGDLKKGEFFDRYEEFRSDNNVYKHTEHVAEILGVEWPVFKCAVEAKLSNAGQSVHFCFDDAHDFITLLGSREGIEVALLTFGEEEFQRFKINLCPVTASLSAHIVSEPKADFLKVNFGGETKGFLLDDKTPLNLPDNWEHVWINRRGHKLDLAEHDHEVKNLREAAGLLLQ